MTRSKHPNVYSDVAAVLDAALASRTTAVYKTGSPAEAIAWRGRAYQLRKILLNLSAETTPPGLAPVSKYDHIFLQISKEDPSCVIISIRKPTGTLTTQDGTVIPVGVARDVQRDPLEDELDRLLGE